MGYIGKERPKAVSVEFPGLVLPAYQHREAVDHGIYSLGLFQGGKPGLFPGPVFQRVQVQAEDLTGAVLFFYLFIEALSGFAAQPGLFYHMTYKIR